VDQLGRAAALQAAILNAAYMVRYYSRGGRVSDSSPIHAKRAEAIEKMGRVVRDAFNESTEFETLLAAVVVGLSKDDLPPF
jgi:hypothetical protein